MEEIMFRAWLEDRANYDIRLFHIDKTYPIETIFGHKLEVLVNAFPIVVDRRAFQQNRMLESDKQEELIDHIFYDHLQPTLHELGVVYWWPVLYTTGGLEIYDPRPRQRRLRQNSAGRYVLEINPTADID